MTSTLVVVVKESFPVTCRPPPLEQVRLRLEMLGPGGGGGGAGACVVGGALGCGAGAEAAVSVGCSGGGKLNVVVGVHVPMVGGATVVSLGVGWPGAAVVEDVVVIAAGATARAGPLRRLNIQKRRATTTTAATETPMAMVRLRRVSAASPSKLIAECP